jgi:murein DD-endopeptidase MepM/ murein hydrolase activator NlpD
VVALFPAGHHRRLTVLLVLLLTAAVLWAPLASADDDSDLKNKQKTVQRQIDHADDDLDESSAALAKATRALRAAQGSLATAEKALQATRVQLAAAAAQDAKMQALLDRAVAALETARVQLAQGREDVARQKQALADLVTSIYEQGDPRLIGLAAMANAGDPGDMTRAIAFNESYTDRENAVLDAVEAAEQRLAEREASVQKYQEEVAANRAQAAANLHAKQALEQRAASQTAQVKSLVSQRSAAQAAASRIAQHDRAILSQLKKQERHIAAVLAERARKALAQGGGGGNRGGFLDYPVNAPITSYYGWRRHPIFGDMRLHNGVDFGAGCGQGMYAPANGTVVAKGGGDSDPSGNYLFVDHGAHAGVGLSTSYSHAIRYVVSVGQHVNRGQLLGYVGSTGWSTGCHLHFTVKENGVDVDPMKWL